MEEIIAQKRCMKCGEDKLISGFCCDKSETDGLNKYCRICKNKDIYRYHATHREEAKKYGRGYRAAHREENNKRLKEYKRKHRKEASEYERKRYAINKEKIRRRQRELNANRREELAKYRREYYRIHHTAERNAEYSNRRRARKVQAGGDGVTAKQWSQLKKDYGERCAYCNQKKPLEMDHVIPLSKGGRHDIDNIVPACGICNASKYNHSLLIFLYRQHEFPEVAE